jgi:hypothetical protein
MAWLRAALAVVLVVGAGCDSESLGGNDPNAMMSGTGGAATGGTGNVGVIPTGSGGVAGAGGGAGMVCGITTTAAAAAPVAPNILVVFDQSATMADDANEMTCSGGCGASSKSSLLMAAMEDVIAANPQVNWGLSLFGGDQGCLGPTGVTVNVGPGNLMPIIAALSAAPPPAGEAPVAQAIYNATNWFDALANLDTIHPRTPGYIMLVTDGFSSCSSRAGEDAVSVGNAISSAASAGWPTFVVGMAPAWDTTASANLDLWAQSGGVAKQPGNTFYAPTDLNSVLSAQTSLASACTIPLSTPPVSGVTLAVSVMMADGSLSEVPQDPSGGWSFWDYTETTIALNGQWCDDLKAGKITSVSVYYACPVLDLGDVLR